MGGDVLGMLVYLQVWTRGFGIQLKLFDPRSDVRRKIEKLHSTIELEIASMDDLLSMLHWEGPGSREVGSGNKPPELKAA